MDKSRVVVVLKRAGQLFVTFLRRWGLLAIGSIFLTWYLQYRIFGNDADAAWRSMDEKPMIFWYSTLIIFTIIVIIYGIFHRPFRTIGVGFALITIITYINNTKVSFRGTPLLPEDFQMTDQAGALTNFIDTGELTRIILASVLAVGLGFLLDYLMRYMLAYLPVYSHKDWQKRKKKARTNAAKRKYKKTRIGRIAASVAVRIILIPLGIWAFFTATNPILYHSGTPSLRYEWLDNAEFTTWDQAITYEQTNFLLGFLYNIAKYDVEPPQDYNKEKISEIKSAYTKLANAEPNVSKMNLKNADYNIIVVLNESFYDPTILQDVYPFNGPDPLENFHRLMETYPAGYMYSPEYGGGTANIEFESDTGLSNFWVQTTPYTSILPKLDHITSIANEAKANGYKTLAIHSYTGELYKRSYALPIEGFDEFITQDKMSFTERNDSSCGYIDDSSTYAETIKRLESSNKKQLISVITMQNHAPYWLGGYSEEERLFWFENPEEIKDDTDMILAYLQSVYYSDQSLGEFLEKLKDFGEKTVVLFFGDHAPGVFGSANVSSDKQLSNRTHLTPYFIWANFEVKDNFSNQKYGEELSEKFGIESEHATLPTTTPNCLTSNLYEILGLKRTAESLITKEACAENPILTPVYLTGSQPTGKSTEAYKLLNYDILNGEQYWFKQ
ncbi:LTA synthase family protein [Candidatus Saccharibacteria bacterium]|nr:LTA synthase family protein [Candidatus Saccharibacteria bacterium]MBQ3467956.1 LTA synthase family protein [Candidatus Saccharibacteria bacterium]